MVMTETLRTALAGARVAATAPQPGNSRDLVLGILRAAADDPEVQAALRDVPAGRALLRFTDTHEAIEFSAGEGRLAASAAAERGPGPKVDATSATWLGLIAGTLKPWLAFTRGMVVCRAGISELRWMQQVAERLQKAYAE